MAAELGPEARGSSSSSSSRVSVSVPALAARRGRLPLGRWLLTGAVVGWFAVLVLVPALALARAALAGGLRPFLEALATGEARQAFALTMWMTLLATAVNTAFGLALAIVLVRHDFR